jgi:glycosyltransferase involved in cell wall biosynthesis
MESTIRQSILSISNQLDDNFEILVVDGGSTDGSISILEDLKLFIKNLKIIKLKRDRKRLLGEDRNISIREASGKYILLHLDCDDVYYPFIKSWIKVYHLLEKYIGEDYLISGKHINMAKKNTLLKTPYRNLQMEDRNLWMRFFKKNKFIEFDHIDIAYRLDKTKKRKLYDIIDRTIKFSTEDLKSYPYGLFYYFFHKLFLNKNISFKIKFLNVCLFPIILYQYLFIIKKTKKSGKDYEHFIDEWNKFRNDKTSIDQILLKHNINYLFEEFSKFEKKIFMIRGK